MNNFFNFAFYRFISFQYYLITVYSTSTKTVLVEYAQAGHSHPNARPGTSTIPCRISFNFILSITRGLKPWGIFIGFTFFPLLHFTSQQVIPAQAKRMAMNEVILFLAGQFFVGLCVDQLHAFDVFGKLVKGGGEFVFEG